VEKMPLVEIYFGKGTITDEQKAELSKKIIELIVKETNQPQQYTWVVIHEVNAEHGWSTSLPLSPI
jgi:4-oxalocrotonate tautomerase family enzyme